MNWLALVCGIVTVVMEGVGVERPFEFGDKLPDSNAKPFGLKTGQRPL